MFNFLTYKKLRNDNWKRYSIADKLAIFQKMEKIEARRLGRRPLNVTIKSLPENVQGLCVESENAIYLIEDFFTRPFMQFWGLSVLFHEGRHSYQQQRVRVEEDPALFSRTYKWKRNMEGYVNYDKNEKYSYYAMQDIERDANKYALKRLRRLRFWLKNEQGFEQTIEVKQNELDKQVKLAKKELGFFYKLKIKMRNNRERKKKR